MDNNQEIVLPKHIGLITDGNRRWAKSHGLPSLEGHRRGFEAVKKVVEAAKKRGIRIFTFWCFSTENWDRSKDEIAYLMDLFEESLGFFLKKYSKDNVRVKVMGQKWRLRASLQKKIAKIEEATKNNNGMLINLGLSYGGRDEIVQVVREIVEKGIDAEKIDEKLISDMVWTPDVDLIIRTGGEKRLSGYLLWQSQYAELLFLDKHLPDFNETDLEEAIKEFSRRQRRFGK